jgi:serine/threonine protein kinase
VTWSQTLLAGRWRLGPKLGSGGQGHTYLARDEKAQGPGERLVAIKELRLGEGGWKRFDLFEREARVLARLSHPGIPRYLDRIDGEKGTFYLVMEQAPGETLRALAARRRFSEDEVREIADQLLDILEYLHGRDPPVVHRDIKPANLLLSREGRLSLVDFGGVRDALREDGEGGSTMIGTFGYMAPEQLHGEATPRTDLYGAGATMVALAAGIEPERVPRKGIKMDLGKPLRGLSGDLRKLIERLVDPDPAKRPASAAEARKLLWPGGAKQRVAIAPRPEPELEEPGDDEPLVAEPAFASEWVREIEELALPRPLKVVLRIAFGLVGLAGHVGLLLVAMIVVPLGFAVGRAIGGKERDEKLRLAEHRVQAVLKETRRNFRALSRNAFRPPPPRRLAARPPPPRLPRGRR